MSSTNDTSDTNASQSPLFDEYPRDNDFYSQKKVRVDEYKHTMEDLEDKVNRLMIQECKLDACVDWFLYSILRINPDYSPGYWSNLPDFQALKGEQLDTITAELQQNLDRLIPGLLDGCYQVLEHKKIKKRLVKRWKLVLEQRSYRRFSEQEIASEDDVRTSLLDTLMEKQYQERAVGASPDTSTEAFTTSCRQLKDFVDGERTTASFSCGDTIPIAAAGTALPESEEVSAPVSIFWSMENDFSARKLVLPLNGESEDSTAETLRHLVASCDPASFGRGNQDVIDPEYRKAGKINPDQFATSFHPADFGIIKKIEQVLLPSISSERDNKLQFRKIHAELYKMNVYSGPSGLFRKHVDTPRSENQIGSLVVCLPSSFKGGSLIVQHNGHEVEFDWDANSASAIQWAAFYSDCEHEIKTITEGDRITLTYNLYVAELGKGTASSDISIVDPKTLPLYGWMRDLLTGPGFMDKGGVLGIFCSHAYAHASEMAQLQLPRSLKGADLVLYSVFRSLGIEVDVLPILENDGNYNSENPDLGVKGAVENSKRYYIDQYDGYDSTFLQNYIMHGKRLCVQYTEMLPSKPTDLADIDRLWKLLLMTRRVKGMKGYREFAEENNLPQNPGSFYKADGSRVGSRLRQYLSTYRGQEEDLDVVMQDVWPAYYLPGITWITEPKHEEMAFSQITYGNQASMGTRYSCAAILAVIPPLDKRVIQ